MKKIYYFSFYFLYMFVKMLNKRNPDYSFSAIAYLSTFMMLNLMNILLYFLPKIIIEINPTLFAVIISLPILALNYYLLQFKNKDKQLIKTYNYEWQSNKKKNIKYLVAFLLYLTITIAFCFYGTPIAKNKIEYLPKHISSF
jgi:hypothetical protein